MSDHGTNAGAGSKRKVYKVPAQRIGVVRCDAGHPVSNLFIIWAPTPDPAAGGDGGSAPAGSDGSSADGGAAGGGQKPAPVFTLSLTDGDGYLSPPTGAGSDWTDSHKLMAGAKYDAWLVRHPSREQAQAILEKLQAGSTDYDDKKQSLTAALVDSGSGGAAVKEVALTVPESAPDKYIQIETPSDRYGNWLLFRDMPHAACPPVKSQVSKLQKDLGSLKYIVGEAESPYTAPTSQKSKSENAPRDGVFGIYVWNALLAFQRDAKVKKASKPAPTSSDPHASDAVDADAVLPAGIDAADIVALAHADQATATTINHWKQSGFQKPGSILVELSCCKSCWMRNDAATRYEKAFDRLKHGLNYAPGLPGGSSFRDTYVDVGSAGFGRSRLSIHKSGLAMDLRTKSRDLGNVNLAFPVIRTRIDIQSKPGKHAGQNSKRDDDEKQIRWELLIEVPLHGAPAEYCKPKADDWVYDPTDANGGHSIERTAPLGQTYLNMTQLLAKEFGFYSIPSKKGHWYAVFETDFPLDPVDLFGFLQRMGFHQQFNPAGPFYRGTTNVSRRDYSAPRNEAYPGETSYLLSNPSVKKDLEYLGKWSSEMDGFAPSPAVTVAPLLPSAAKIVAKLRSNGLKNRVVTLVDDNGPREVTLSPKVQLPSRFSVKPKLSALSFDGTGYFRFPQIDGEAIGLEWWHYQLGDAIAKNAWGDLLGAIGWTREGLGDKALGPDNKTGLGYSDDDLAKQAR